MQEAFAALITKRRETHVRNVATTEYKSERPPPGLAPPLRLEPAPSYYLRTARAYAFLADFLGEAIGQEALGELHGLTKDGLRPKSLADELPWMRDLFFGCYLISAEDIDLRAGLGRDGSPVDSAWADDTERQRCYSPGRRVARSGV
jgi:hypothetical protein